MQLVNDRYQLKKVLGQGGMGRVYLARDVLRSCYVAVKECFVSPQAPREKIRRIKREYYFMKKIDHPHIVKAFDFFQWGTNYFIVMEYIEGVTLTALIRRAPHSITFDKQIEISKQVCSAMVALHSNGIIHRDLKPDNIMLVGKEYAPKILDLGIAKSINKELTTLTRQGEVFGTASYMSPEQINGKVTKNMDVFSLGVILYQFFAWQKRSPFFTENPMMTVTRILQDELPPLDRICDCKDKRLPILSTVLNKALQKKSALRFRSMVPLHTRIQHLEKGRFFHFVHRYVLGIPQLFATVLFLSFGVWFFSPGIANNQKDITSLMNKIVRCVGTNQHRRIVDYATQIIAIDSNYSKAYFQRGVAYITLRENQKARSDFHKVLTLEPKNAKAYNNLGIVYERQNNYVLAKESYDQAILLNPRYVQAYMNRGILHARKKFFKFALQDYTSALSLNRKYASAYLHRASLYASVKKYNLADEDFKQAVLLEPNNSFIYYNRAIMYMRQKRYQLAENQFQKALQLNAENFINVCIDRGICYMEQKKYQLSEKDFNYVIALRPKNIKAYQLRAKLYEVQDKFHLAEQDFSKIVELAPHESISYALRASYYTRRTKYLSAEKDFAKAMQLNPNLPEINSALAYAYLNLQKNELAEKYFSKAIDLNPLARGYFFNRSIVRRRQGKLQEALEDMTQFIALNANDFQAYVKKGEILMEQKKYMSAINSFSEAIRLGANKQKLQALIDKAQKLMK